MLFNTLNLIYLNVTMPNLTRKIFTQISLAGLYSEPKSSESLCIHVLRTTRAIGQMPTNNNKQFFVHSGIIDFIPLFLSEL